ncbi:MAG: hypothetical protein JO176_09650 [Acidimicrobiia bacterium]|nr:hypothetical protein [Acidimicrobiia bacterium]
MSEGSERRGRLLLEREPDVRVTCPNDGWTFAPRYTDGRCPIDGWKAPVDVAPPRFAQIDWFWPALIAMAVVSILMGVLVVLAYVRA